MSRSKQLYAVSGLLGATPGMDTGTSEEINEDDDGERTSPNFIVDLSHLLSQRLGKQMSQMATYRVKGFRIELQNADDSNDNNYGLCVGGTIGWYSPTAKRIDALQYARQFKRDMRYGEVSDSGDPFSPYRTSKGYTGMRFNWTEDNDGVYGAVDDGTTILSGTEFSMYEIFDHYNEAIGGNPGEEGYGTGTGAGNALWVTRLGEGQVDNIGWTTSYLNSAYHDSQDLTLSGDAFVFQPDSRPYELMLSNNHFDVLGGLLKVAFKHNNTKNPRAVHVDDEYKVRLTVFIEGWEGF